MFDFKQSIGPTWDPDLKLLECNYIRTISFISEWKFIQVHDILLASKITIELVELLTENSFAGEARIANPSTILSHFYQEFC